MYFAVCMPSISRGVRGFDETSPGLLAAIPEFRTGLGSVVVACSFRILSFFFPLSIRRDCGVQ